MGMEITLIHPNIATKDCRTLSLIFGMFQQCLENDNDTQKLQIIPNIYLANTELILDKCWETK